MPDDARSDARPEAWPDRLAARADAALTAVGLTGAVRRDAALAVVLAALTVAVLASALADPELARLTVGDGGATVVVLVALQTLALAGRRRHPVACLAVVVALQVVLTLAVPVGGGGVRGPAPLVAAYTCGTRIPVRRAAALAAAAALVESLPVALPGLGGTVGGALSQLLAAGALYLAATLVGGYVTERRRNAELLALRALDALDAQRARADAAVQAERVRIARELHDLAAHHLAGLVVQAAVVERLVDRDPEAARRTAAEVRARGRATLHDLRLVVGTLRDGADPADGDAAVARPGLATLDELVAAAADAAGSPVELVTRGGPRELPAPADVAVHRVAQEALANARDHAPGAPVTVAVTHAPDASVLEVRNGPPATARESGAVPVGAGEGAVTGAGARRGFGLVGMRERAELAGATLDAGPTDDGGWSVRLSLPWTEGTSP